MTLTRLAHTIVLAWGWRRILIAFLAGAATTLALPPTDVWPVPFVTFPILVWLVDGAAAGRLGGVVAAATAGWWFGFGYFLAGLYWVGNAFLVDAKIFGWLLPFAVIGLPAGMAVYTALGLALARLIWMRGATRVLALAVALTVAEWLRGHLLSGFPWNTYGYALVSPLWLAQGAALIGIWGLTFLAVAIYASPAVLADDRADSKRPWLAPALSVLVIAAIAAYGALRLSRTPTTYVEGVRLRIMQPNLQQDEKFNYAQKQQVMSRYLALSDRATGPQSMGVRDVTHLIWPESAFPFFLTREAEALAQIAALLPKGTVLITGAIRAPEDATGPLVTRAYNSIYLIDHDGSVLPVYDKVHLVPFGEYVPLPRLFFFARRISQEIGEFTAASEPVVLRSGPFALGVGVCYEIIYPPLARRQTEEGANLLATISNDSWYGRAGAQEQHFAGAVLRSVENGRYLVRSAITGISGAADSRGQIFGELPANQAGTLRVRVRLLDGKTVWTRWGHGLPYAADVAALAMLIFGLARRRSARRARGGSNAGAPHGETS